MFPHVPSPTFPDLPIVRLESRSGVRAARRRVRAREGQGHHREGGRGRCWTAAGPEVRRDGLPECVLLLLVSRLAAVGLTWWIALCAALKWFGPEGGEPEKYEGGRDLDALANL